MRKLFISTLLIGLTCNFSSAQRTCGSDFDPEVVRKTDPKRYQRFLEMEQHTKQYTRAIGTSGSGNQRILAPNAVILIPVVVHIIHPSGQAIGTGRNISMAQIQSQIAVLNEDYRRTNADRVNTPGLFNNAASDPQIEFRLACIDPNGNPTNGVTRTATSQTGFTQNDDIKRTANGGRDPWPTKKYLNIWVGNLSPTTLLGYAQLPVDFATKPNTDGVVVQTTCFGRTGNAIAPHNLGRITTHEVGHWLNLFHIFGTNTGCSDDDFCNDTPLQGAARQGCPAFPSTSCTSTSDMFMNYMDYTDDACMNIFTNDQRDRMRSIFFDGGARQEFIDNFFYINSTPFPQGDGFCVGNQATFSVWNPLCLPVTWSVSGPVSITSGATGNVVTIQATGNGKASVRADGGAFYTFSREIITGVPEIEFVSFFNPNNPYEWCSNTYGNVFSIQEASGANASYEWEIRRYPNMNLVYSGQVNSPGGTVGYMPQGWYIFRARPSNACGTGDWYETEVGNFECSTEGGGGEEDDCGFCEARVAPLSNQKVNTDTNMVKAKQNRIKRSDLGTLATRIIQRVYPNPASSFLQVELKVNKIQKVKIDVIDAMGIVRKIVFSGNIEPGTKTITVTGLATGNYRLRLISDNGSEYYPFLIVK